MISVESTSIMECLLETIYLANLNRLLNFVNMQKESKTVQRPAYFSTSTSVPTHQDCSADLKRKMTMNQIQQIPNEKTDR